MISIRASANPLLTLYFLSYRRLSPYLRSSLSRRRRVPRDPRMSRWNLQSFLQSSFPLFKTFRLVITLASLPVFSLLSFPFFSYIREQMSTFTRIAPTLSYDNSYFLICIFFPLIIAVNFFTFMTSFETNVQ